MAVVVFGKFFFFFFKSSDMELETAKYHTNQKKFFLEKQVYCPKDRDAESSHSDVVDFDSEKM